MLNYTTWMTLDDPAASTSRHDKCFIYGYNWLFLV